MTTRCAKLAVVREQAAPVHPVHNIVGEGEKTGHPRGFLFGTQLVVVPAAARLVVSSLGHPPLARRLIKSVGCLRM